MDDKWMMLMFGIAACTAVLIDLLKNAPSIHEE